MHIGVEAEESGVQLGITVPGGVVEKGELLHVAAVRAVLLLDFRRLPVGL